MVIENFLFANYLKTIAQDLGLLSLKKSSSEDSNSSEDSGSSGDSNSSEDSSSSKDSRPSKDSNPELIFLKWLISCQFPKSSNHSYNEELQKQMIESCKCKGLEIYGQDYQKAIYEYALNRLPECIQGKRASEHEILLYAYAALTESTRTNSPKFLWSIINSSTKNLEPYLIPKKKGRIDEELIETFYGQLPAIFCGLDFVERVIFTFYLWLADISTKEHYDVEVSTLTYTPNTFKEPTVNISDENVAKIWEACTQSQSRYGYYYCQSEKKGNYDTLQSVFNDYIGFIPEKHFSFVPSLVTLFFNRLEPNNPKEFKDIDKFYDLIKKSDWNDPSFFKMLLLEPIYLHSENKKKKSIYKRFEDEKRFIPNECQFNDTLEEYINSLDGHDREIAQHFFSSCKHDFYFTYSYFEIFLYVYEHQDLFKTKKKMDFALSVLHLNNFTKWFDAFMLVNDMPFDFRNYNFFYLKLLSIYPTFEPIIRYLSNITVSVSNDKVAVGYNGETIQLENFLLEFYKKANERLNPSRLLDIVKSYYVDDSKVDDSKEENLLHSILSDSNKQIHFSGINPIYEWIFLLEHNDISEEHLEQLCYSGYYDFLHEKSNSTSWRTPITLPDPFSDDFDVYDGNNFF